MALFSRVKTWVSNEVLTAADLNAEFDNILNNSVASSIIGASANVTAMQATVDPGDVGSESLAASVAGELQRLRYVIKRIIGEAQWYSTPTRTLATGNLQIDTADLKDESVTLNKLAAPNCVVSDAITGTPLPGRFSVSVATPTDVPGLEVEITTTGRFLWVGLVSSRAIAGVEDDGFGGIGDVTVIRTPSAPTAVILGSIMFLCDNNIIDYLNVSGSVTTEVSVVNSSASGSGLPSHTHTANTTVATGKTLTVPLSVFQTIIKPDPGTHILKVQAATNGLSGMTISNARLVVYEF